MSDLQRFYTPALPRTVEEFRSRGFDPDDAIVEIGKAFIDQSLTRQDIDNLSPLTKVIKVEDGMARLILSYWNVDGYDREAILAIIFHTSVGQEFFETLSEEDRVVNSGPWVRPMVKTASDNEFPRYALAALLASTEQTSWPTLIAKMEDCRKANNISTAIYRECNKLPGFALPF